jgi:FixJ family two-component response regulator
MAESYSRSVLIVDDDASDRKLFWRELYNHGFPVVVTGSPDDAIAAVVGGSVGCLVADHMTAADGEQLAHIAAGIRSDISIVVFSGASEPRTPIPPGAIFVSKNDPQKLIRAVNKCMQRWRVKP